MTQHVRQWLRDMKWKIGLAIVYYCDIRTHSSIHPSIRYWLMLIMAKAWDLSLTLTLLVIRTYTQQHTYECRIHVCVQKHTNTFNSRFDIVQTEKSVYTRPCHFTLRQGIKQIQHMYFTLNTLDMKRTRLERKSATQVFWFVDFSNVSRSVQLLLFRLASCSTLAHSLAQQIRIQPIAWNTRDMYTIFRAYRISLSALNIFQWLWRWQDAYTCIGFHY